ncbi:RNHCP domain-containing protein [Deinococcus sp. NW-56]|uniref:RNHCP domain-containing protein n=1 Tax=Deinococcus sp. NW-56 TaxID=2080419 RepID=UPI000CF36F09|nr:RNHCP domain-containing protein [Deinococcus sp. NW-56]
MSRRFTVQGTNNAFACAHCGAQVQPLGNGSVRNHCPECLHSLHVDILPGDRASDCHGVMDPVGVDQSGKKGWVILHRCRKCGYQGRNKAALDDSGQPDSWDALVALSRRVRE